MKDEKSKTTGGCKSMCGCRCVKKCVTSKECDCGEKNCKVCNPKE